MPDLALFDRVVAENGAVLHTPATGQVRLLARPPLPSFAARLAAAGVDPLHQGRVIVETWQEHEAKVRAVIQELGLDLAVVTNKGALMIVPVGVSKASGTAGALRQMGVPPPNCVAVGGRIRWAMGPAGVAPQAGSAPRRRRSRGVETRSAVTVAEGRAPHHDLENIVLIASTLHYRAWRAGFDAGYLGLTQRADTGTPSALPGAGEARVDINLIRDSLAWDRLDRSRRSVL